MVVVGAVVISVGVTGDGDDRSLSTVTMGVSSDRATIGESKDLQIALVALLVT